MPPRVLFLQNQNAGGYGYAQPRMGLAMNNGYSPFFGGGSGTYQDQSAQTFNQLSQVLMMAMAMKGQNAAIAHQNRAASTPPNVYIIQAPAAQETLAAPVTQASPEELTIPPMVEAPSLTQTAPVFTPTGYSREYGNQLVQSLAQEVSKAMSKPPTRTGNAEATGHSAPDSESTQKTEEERRATISPKQIAKVAKLQIEYGEMEISNDPENSNIIVAKDRNGTVFRIYQDGHAEKSLSDEEIKITSEHDKEAETETETDSGTKTKSEFSDAQAKAVKKMFEQTGAVGFDFDPNNPKVIVSKPVRVGNQEEIIQILPNGTIIERIKNNDKEVNAGNLAKGTQGGFWNGFIGGAEALAGAALIAGSAGVTALSLGILAPLGMLGVAAGTAAAADGGRRVYNSFNEETTYKAKITTPDGKQTVVEYNNQSDLEGKIAAYTNTASQFTK